MALDNPAATLSDIPVEVVIEHVLPHLRLRELLALGVTSKHMHKIVSQAQGLLLYWLLKHNRVPTSIAHPVPVIDVVAIIFARLPAPVDDRALPWMLSRGLSPTKLFFAAAALGDVSWMDAMAAKMERRKLQRCYQKALANSVANRQVEALAWLLQPGRLETRPGQAAQTYERCHHCRLVWDAVLVEALTHGSLKQAQLILDFMGWAPDKVPAVIMAADHCAMLPDRILDWLLDSASPHQARLALLTLLKRELRNTRQLPLPVLDALVRVCGREPPQLDSEVGADITWLVQQVLEEALMASRNGRTPDKVDIACMQFLHHCGLLGFGTVMHASTSNPAVLPHQRRGSERPALLLTMICNGHVQCAKFVFETFLLPLNELQLVLLMQPSASMQEILLAAVESNKPEMIDLIMDVVQPSEWQVHPRSSKLFERACYLGFTYALTTIMQRSNFTLDDLRQLRYKPLITSIRPLCNVVPALRFLYQQGFNTDDILSSRLLQRLLVAGARQGFAFVLHLMQEELQQPFTRSVAQELIKIACQKDLADVLPLILSGYGWSYLDLSRLADQLRTVYGRSNAVKHLERGLQQILRNRERMIHDSSRCQTADASDSCVR